MYKRLSEYRTKKKYVEVLDETIDMLNKEIEKNGDSYMKYILSQLLAVKDCTKDGKCILSPNLIERYFNFGGYAVKNFPEDDELGIRLRDLYGGLYDFNNYTNLDCI